MTKETEDLVAKAITENRPLYAARAVSGDGDYIETVRFNTFLESMQYAENMFSLGAENVTFHILSVDDLKAEEAMLEKVPTFPKLWNSLSMDTSYGDF